jgi:hypothetical protein
MHRIAAHAQLYVWRLGDELMPLLTQSLLNNHSLSTQSRLALLVRWNSHHEVRSLLQHRPSIEMTGGGGSGDCEPDEELLVYAAVHDMGEMFKVPRDSLSLSLSRSLSLFALSSLSHSCTFSLSVLSLARSHSPFLSHTHSLAHPHTRSPPPLPPPFPPPPLSLSPRC